MKELGQVIQIAGVTTAHGSAPPVSLDLDSPAGYMSGALTATAQLERHSGGSWELPVYLFPLPAAVHTYTLY